MLSSGAKRDFLVLQFAKSLIEVSKKDESKADDDLFNRDDNKDYKLNRRIDRALDKLSDRMNETINALYKEGGRDVAEWTRKNLPRRVGGTLTKIQESTINLEMLAMWVMYVNFAESERKLHKEFEWCRDAEQYFKITELMTDTKIAGLEEAMFKTAYDVIARIKG